MSDLPVNTYKVVWFPPDRPVEGNTIYIRPVADFDRRDEASPQEDQSQIPG